MKRRGFTLFEVIVSLGLVSLLVVAMGAFLSDALRIRARVADRVSRGLVAEAAMGEIERALETCLVADPQQGAGVRGDATSIEVLRAGLSTWRLGTAEPRRAFEPIERCRVFFDQLSGRVAIGRDERAPTPVPGSLHRLRLRYFDGRMWRDQFDSARAGRLPVAVEVSIWFDGETAEAVPLARPEFDDEGPGAAGLNGTSSSGPDTPPDRRRIIAIPDPAGETGLPEASESSSDDSSSRSGR